MKWTNWSGLASCHPAEVVRPRSVEEVQAAVKDAAGARRKVRPVGSGHSFPDIACTDDVHLTLRHLTGIRSVDTASLQVTLNAGTSIIEAAESMAEKGLAFQSLGDIGKQSIAGAIATGTHGTGITYPGISGQVTGLEIVDGSGDLISLDAGSHGAGLRAGQVSLGALGVVTAVTLQAEPVFNLLTEFRPVPWEQCLADLEENVTAHEHFEFFWFPGTDVALALSHDRTVKEPRPPRPLRHFVGSVVLGNWMWATLLWAGRRRSSLVPALNRHMVDRTGTGGKRVARGDRAFVNERRVRFAEMEYAIPAECAIEALVEVRRTIETGRLVVDFPIEVRFSCADGSMIGPASGRDTAWVAVHQSKGRDHTEYFSAVEEIMIGFGGRPHWGKLHTRTHETLAPLYPEWESYRAVRRRLDPEGVFANSYVDRVLGPV